jgi:AAA+ superfamily predicted ATPase
VKPITIEGMEPAKKPAPVVPPTATPPSPPPTTAAGRELDVLIRARYPLIYVVSWEEERVELLLAEIAKARNKKFYTWTLTQGLVRQGTGNAAGKPNSTTDPIQAMNQIIDHVDPGIFLFKDLHPHMKEAVGCARCNLPVIRKLRDVAAALRDSYKSVVIVSPIQQIAPELGKDVTVLEFDLPGIPEFSRLLDKIIEDVKSSSKVKIELDRDGRERLLHAAQGLTLKEAENVFAKTIVLDGKLDATDVSIVFSEKQQIIRKSGLLDYYESEEDLDKVAGLDNLKQWLETRGLAFSERAVDFGLPAPRGVLLLGVQGCGKSLSAKAAANLWKMPLLRLDIGRMFGSLVGSSEENMRRAIQTAESVAPAVLWVDEIDKAFSSANQSGGGDAGTAQRVFSTFLTWLSEKKSSVFVIATANDISRLPPELLRKGRLDEIFFVDLPNETERRDVFRIHLSRRGRDTGRFDLVELSRLSEGFSGAEIEEAVISGLFDAFSANQDIDQEILRQTLSSSVPLSKTMSEDLQRLRNWANGRARPASGDSVVEATASRRKLEL